ncbi:MAG: nitroreductase [Dehalococcoidia bacterium]|nr:nitroreductase [Dehalococcoidia bacterium]MDD5493903.1 nitroreductase [Dehalococcoidia bacterium]
MDIIEALKTRRSIRGFKQDPVSRETIHKILEAAIRTPSGMNTQPWEFVVAGGKVLDRIREECGKLFNQGVIPTNDMLRKPFEGVYRQRQVDLAMQIFSLMGIAREDREARKQWMLRGFRFFDAPCQIVICAEKEMQYHLDMLALGAICQSICLAALGYGLGTCIADQGIMYDHVWRQYAAIPESKRLVAGIAVGYPDNSFPANRLVTGREPVGNITTWLGFD